MLTSLIVNNADNQLVVYLNDEVVYNKSHGASSSLTDNVDLTDRLIPGTNSLLILGVNWSGPASYKGGVSLDGAITPWEYHADSPPIGVIWRRLFVITNPDGATVTITFSGLAPGGSTLSYTESGYTLSDDNIYTDYENGTKGAFPYNPDSLFTLKRADGASFNLVSVMLKTLNDQVGSQTVVFTGNLTDGGTVVHQVTTPADFVEYSTYAFPASFAKLASVVWSQHSTVITNVNVVPSAGIK